MLMPESHIYRPIRHGSRNWRKPSQINVDEEKKTNKRSLSRSLLLIRLDDVGQQCAASRTVQSTSTSIDPSWYCSSNVMCYSLALLPLGTHSRRHLGEEKQSKTSKGYSIRKRRSFYRLLLFNQQPLICFRQHEHKKEGVNVSGSEKRKRKRTSVSRLYQGVNRSTSTPIQSIHFKRVCVCVYSPPLVPSFCIPLNLIINDEQTARCLFSFFLSATIISQE